MSRPGYLLLPALLAAMPGFAHTISMSTGELTITGARAVYRLKMPAYELQHVADPRTALPDAVRIEGATRTGETCTADSLSMTCTSQWQFERPPESIRVTSRLREITVPNHVHVLSAKRDGLLDRAVFDERSETATLRFRQPGMVERVFSARPVSALAILLACVAAGVAARSRKELIGTSLAFGLGVLAGCFIPWLMHARFLEAAIALTCAYIAFEALALPLASWRAIAPALLGVALGLYFQFLAPGNAPAWAAVAIVLSIPLAFAGLRSNRALPAAVLVVSAVWFTAILAL